MPSAEARQATLAYRQQTLALRAVVVRELARLWPALDWTRLDATYPAWALSVGRLVHQHRQTSAQLAAAYLQAFKQAEGMGLAPVALRAELNAEQLATSLRVTSVVAAKKSAAAGKAAELAMQDAFVMSAGEMSRLVLDAGRDTVVESLRRDPDARGWQRVVSGKGCDFCVMLSDRGAVYSAASVGFASHGHCGCTAEPVYGNDSRPVRTFTPSARNISDKDRARLRDYLSENYG